MIFHTLKMCSGDAGPEQGLVLFLCLQESIILVFMIL